MIDIPRLNSRDRSVGERGTAFVTFCPPEPGAAIAIGELPMTASSSRPSIVPYDIRVLGTASSACSTPAHAGAGTLAPSVAPMVRHSTDGGEMNQWLAKQVLDAGAYGVIWPHVSTVEERAMAVARGAAPNVRPSSTLPGFAAIASPCRRSGPDTHEYYGRATPGRSSERRDLWSASCARRCRGAHLPQMLKEIPGIGVVILGEGDLSRISACRGNHDHSSSYRRWPPCSRSARSTASPAGIPHVGKGNVEKLVPRVSAG